MGRKAALGVMLALLLMCTLGLAFDIPLPKAEPPSGMVSYWKFDEESGTAALDSINYNDGAICGATRIAGKVGGALSCDGIDDYVEVSDSDSLDITDAITLEAWISPATFSINDIISKHASPGGVYDAYFIQMASQRLRFGLNDGVGNYVVFDSSGTLTANTWYHIAGTWDGTTMRIYVNGAQDANTQSFIGPIQTTHLPVGIGRNGGTGWYEYFDGKIDEVAIYNQALTPEEIQQHYENGLKGLGYYVESIQTIVDFEPDTLNLRSKGHWIAAYIQLPEGYNAADINATTILLNGTISPVLDPGYGFVTNSSEYLVDHNNDGILERMVKFDRATVESWIYHTQVIRYGNVALAITGKLLDGTPFEGTDTIFVNYAGDANNDGIINSLDIGVINAHWSTNDSIADLNKDGKVNSLDIGIINANWGQTTP